MDAPGSRKRCEVLWGERQGWIPCNDSIPIGTRVTLECPEFYERETGATHTTCLHNGNWSQVPLRCHPICGVRETSGLLKAFCYICNFENPAFYSIHLSTCDSTTGIYLTLGTTETVWRQAWAVVLSLSILATYSYITMLSEINNRNELSRGWFFSTY